MSEPRLQPATDPPELDVSVVVPVYRSRETIHAVAERVMAVLDAAALDHELILVDDGSPDDSWEVLEQLQAERPDRIVAVQLMRNFGQHNALMCGLRRARGAVVVTMDDDLQHPPEEIPKLLEHLRETGSDLVYGTYAEKRHDPWRNLGSRLIQRVYRTLFDMRLDFTAFRAIRRELVRTVLTYDLNYTFIDGLLAWNTTRVAAVEVRHDERRDGASGYTLSRLVVLTLNMMTNFSLVPLQAVSWLGMAAAGGGLLLALLLLGMALAGKMAVPGYASIIVAVLVLGGTQLLALGIVGEYLGRVHLNINRKPQYVERDVLDDVSRG